MIQIMILIIMIIYCAEVKWIVDVAIFFVAIFFVAIFFVAIFFVAIFFVAIFFVTLVTLIVALVCFQMGQPLQYFRTHQLVLCVLFFEFFAQ